MNCCWAITAVNKRALCKTRLATVLPYAVRTSLVERMLQHVVSVLQATCEVDQVAVVSPESWKLAAGVLAIGDAGFGLNDALTHAACVAEEAGADRLVIIHADVALLKAADVSALIRAADRTGLALAPDQKGNGTNALCVRLPTELDFAFGPRSLQRHMGIAARHALAPTLVRRPGLAFDMDEIEDFHRLVGDRREELLA